MNNHCIALLDWGSPQQVSKSIGEPRVNCLNTSCDVSANPKVGRAESHSLCLLQQAGAGHGSLLPLHAFPHTFHLCKLPVSQDDIYQGLFPGGSLDVATHPKWRVGRGPAISAVQPWRRASGLEKSLWSVLRCGMDVSTAITSPQSLGVEEIPYSQKKTQYLCAYGVCDARV